MPQTVRSAVRNGVICDLDLAVSVLAPVMRQLRGRLVAPRVLTCVPSNSSAEERATLAEATRAAGASEVALVAEPLASAIGAGLPTGESHARLLVDIGDGVTDLAVIRDGEVIVGRSLRAACGALREALVEYVRQRHEVDVDLDQADDLVASYGRIPQSGTRSSAHASAWRVGSNKPVKLLLPHDEILAATETVEESIVGFVANEVRALPDGIAVEVIESGLLVAGGGALLSRLVSGIDARTGLHVRTARDPLRATITGVRAMLPVAAKTGLWDA
jgi:rod shape-determining protein MreB